MGFFFLGPQMSTIKAQHFKHRNLGVGILQFDESDCFIFV